jgi:LuxR family maltose regulon positive regulatory protein
LIEKSGLFLLPLDTERTWFRYHHLFADFLQRRLREEAPDMERALHARASEWCWNSGLPTEAIEHALRGGNPERAAQLLELRCQDLTYTGKYQLVKKYAAQFSEDILQRCPRVLLTMAWLLARNLRFEETRALLATVRARMAEIQASDTADVVELRKLEYLVLHREMMLAAAEDDAGEVEKQCQHLIDAFAEERHPYLSGSIYSQLLFARREQYRLGDLERLTATAQGILNRSQFAFASIALQASVGPSLFFAGKTDAATTALEQGLVEAVRYGGINSDLAALPGLPLGEVLYETNQVERAAQIVRDTLPFATELGFVDQLRAGFVTRARICRARGDRTGAFSALDQAMTIAIERGLERLQFAVVEERVRLLIQDGRPDLAARCISEAGIAGGAEALLPRGNVTTLHESRAMAWARVAQSDDRSSEALNVARHWRSFCAARGAVRSLVRWEILLAQILFVSGDLRSAQRALREAISRAAPARLIRSFIDEGPVIRNLLAATYDGELEVLHPTDAFASELLEAFDLSGTERFATRPASANPEGLYGKLSPKEREILALVSSGMRNREVAKTLGMTEGSVKWYMQQVYDKVGTRRRLQAVERARQFGLIA